MDLLVPIHRPISSSFLAVGVVMVSTLNKSRHKWVQYPTLIDNGLTMAPGAHFDHDVGATSSPFSSEPEAPLIKPSMTGTADDVLINSRLLPS